MSKPKSSCYEQDCSGPVVETGFRLDQFLVCKKCKSEITKQLAEDIEYRKEKKESLADDEFNHPELWGIYYGNSDDENY